MNIHYYGNACFSLIHNGIHILCDPWLDGPSVAGGWEKFLPSKTKTKDLPKIDYIYLSHIHSDHCEPSTLIELDKSIPVIAIDRKPTFLEKMIRDAGFKNLILVPEGKRFIISPTLTVETFGVSIRHVCADIIDSSILFDFGNHIALNCNDNAPSAELCADLSKRYPKIDVAFLPCGGGSGYPAMYTNLSDSAKAEIVIQAIERFSVSFVSSVDLICPKIVVPVGGGYMIRGPRAKDVNRFQVRRTNLLEVADYYKKFGQGKSMVFPLQPEMILDADNGQIIGGHYHVWSRDEIDAHCDFLSKLPINKNIKTTKSVIAMARFIQEARSNLWKRQQTNKIFPAYTIYLDVETQPFVFELDLSNEEVSFRDRSDSRNEPYLQMSLDQDTMLEWLLGLEDFNMLDSGHRIGFYRVPNSYVVDAYYLMSLLRL